MNKKIVVLIAVLGVLAIAVIWGVSRYNAIITAEEDVNTAWSQVENQYQRRADLIPNFVSTVKGYSDYESSTFQAVTEARSKVADADDVEETEEASNELNSAISVFDLHFLTSLLLFFSYMLIHCSIYSARILSIPVCF